MQVHQSQAFQEWQPGTWIVWVHLVVGWVAVVAPAFGSRTYQADSELFSMQLETACRILRIMNNYVGFDAIDWFDLQISDRDTPGGIIN